VKREAREKGDPMVDYRDKSKPEEKGKHERIVKEGKIDTKLHIDDYSESKIDHQEELPGFKYDVKKEFDADARDLIGQGKGQHANLGRIKKDKKHFQEPNFDVEAPSG
jgi:hypothetical protein